MDPVTQTQINEGFALLSDRMDAISKRSDDRADSVLQRVIQLIEGVAHLQVRMESLLAQVEKATAAVNLHDARLQILEIFCVTSPPLQEQIRALKSELRESAVKRGMWYAQGKAIWGVLVALGSAVIGAWAAHVFHF